VGSGIDPTKNSGDSSMDKFRDAYETQTNSSPMGSQDPFNPEEDIQEIKAQIQALLPRGRGGKLSQQNLILILYLLSREGGDIVQEKAQSLTALSQIQNFISSLNASICGAGAGTSGADNDVTNDLNNLQNALSSVAGNSSLYDTLTGAIDQIKTTITSNGGMSNIWNQFVSGGTSGMSAPSAMNAIMSNVGVLTQSSTSYSAQLNAETSTSTKKYSAQQDLLGNVIKSINQLTQQVISSTSSQR
jgi:hypothetical protein